MNEEWEDEPGGKVISGLVRNSESSKSFQLSIRNWDFSEIWDRDFFDLKFLF